MSKLDATQVTYDGETYSLGSEDSRLIYSGLNAVNTGTVTQATNHSTAVTLNAQAGVITLAGVALNAAAEADFAWTNSYLKTTSVVLLTCQSPAAADATDNAQVTAELDGLANGSANIRLSNPGAGNVATDAYKLHFLVINPA